MIGMNRRHRKKKSKDGRHESHQRLKSSWGTIVLSRERTELNDIKKVGTRHDQGLDIVLGERTEQNGTI